MADRPVHHQTAYDREYLKHDNVIQAERMRTRRAMIKKLGAAALKGKDVDHIKPVAAGGSDALTNARVRSVHANRGDKSVFHDKGYKPVYSNKH